MEGDRVSYHDSILKVYDRIKKDNLALGLYTYLTPPPSNSLPPGEGGLWIAPPQ
jgi:hypothetical protein